MTRSLLLLAIPAAVLLALSCRTGPGEADAMGPNAGCLVCHMTFVSEWLSKTHAAAGVSCARCHGTSAGHANDENIGATKPDRMFRREQVAPFCRTCHPSHDVAPEKVLERWHERYASAKPPAPPAACTDCHGTHKIARKP